MQITKTDSGWAATDYHTVCGSGRGVAGIVEFTFDADGHHVDTTWAGPKPDPIELRELLGEAICEVRREMASAEAQKEDAAAAAVGYER